MAENSASEQDLCSLPGIGERKACQILATGDKGTVTAQDLLDHTDLAIVAQNKLLDGYHFTFGLAPQEEGAGVKVGGTEERTARARGDDNQRAGNDPNL